VEFTCILCGYRSSDPGTCPRCGLPLLYKVRPIKPYKSNMPGVWRYSSVLPRPIRVVSLGEGFTRIRRVNDVVIKYEGNNPTGTYYDRGSAVLASLINGGEVKLTFEEDLTRSLALYLSTVGIETTVSVSYNVDPRDLLILAKLNVKVCVNCIDKPSIDYFNPLLIEDYHHDNDYDNYYDRRLDDHCHVGHHSSLVNAEHPDDHRDQAGDVNDLPCHSGRRDRYSGRADSLGCNEEVT